MRMKHNLLVKFLISVFIFFAVFLISPGKSFGGEMPVIFPIPQQMQFTPDTFYVDEEMSILVPENCSREDMSLAHLLVGELSDKYGLAVKIKSVTNIPPTGRNILMGSMRNPMIKKYCNDNNIALTNKDPGAEGYVLQVRKNLVLIAGWDDQGAFYGVQSLRQLLMDGQGKFVRGVVIRDWPSLPFRGVRLYIPGPENIAFYKRFVRDFMALYKFNKIILEVICMRLDRHPEVNAGWIDFAKYMQYTHSTIVPGLHGEVKNSTHHDAGDGFILEKDEVRDIVGFARENFLEVIPEIPSLTHGFYLLTRHPELAEYQGDKWPDTYCPSNPDSYKLMFDIYDEYIEVMHPRMVHIGHDEWWGAPLGSCPRCKDKDYSELFAQDVNKIHDYFSAKAIKTAMWGDHLLESLRGKGPIDRIVRSTGLKYKTPGALRYEVVEKSIPKDILIFNWFWGDTKKEEELDRFGFKQVYGNFKPNISQWNERIKKVNVIGGSPSAWASTNEFNFGKDLVLDFLGCANFLWSSHTIDQLDLGEIVRNKLMSQVRTAFRGKKAPSQEGDPVMPVDISPYFNLSLNTEALNIGYNPMKTEDIHYKSMIFKMPNNENLKNNSVIAVGTLPNGKLPQNVDGIQINSDVNSILFLHACLNPASNRKAYRNIPDPFDTAELLGWYEIVYDDGYKESVPVQYGVNILEWNPGGEKSLDKREGETGSLQAAYCYQADPIVCSSETSRNPVTFFAYEWVNKHYGKKIKEINLKSAVSKNGNNAVLLYGVSFVKKRDTYPIK